jgi:hypothetical protein
MEHGFYHPDSGYWQTNSDVPQRILDGYPAGTIEVPLRPIGDFNWDGSKWVELPPDLDVLAIQARANRNALLAASDWTQVADAPVDKAAWATYRQTLRDITTKEGFPNDIVWPTKPE